jgi:P27 family predicted phage terminase small subunit
MPPAFKGTPKEVQWRRLTRELAAMGLLTSADADALALYCDTYVRWAEAVRALEREGMIVLTEKGFPVQSPYLGIVNTCTTKMQRLLIEFGMTPASRSRIQVVGEGEEDEFDQFVRGKPSGRASDR